MKIIDAFWEKRNLNVDVTEVELDKRDILDTHLTLSKIAELRSPGRVIYTKIPVGNLNLLHALEDMGFRFLECQIKVSRSLNDYEPPAQMKKTLKNAGVEIVEKNERQLRVLLGRITPGMFNTDRICLDPLWGDAREDLSAIRYKNWISDIFFNQETVIYYANFFDINLGFGIAKKDQRENSVSLLLGGVFEKGSNPFSSISFMNAPLVLFKDKISRIKTSVSSNNLPVCKLYDMFCYQIEETLYVLRFFCE